MPVLDEHGRPVVAAIVEGGRATVIEAHRIYEGADLTIHALQNLGKFSWRAAPATLEVGSHVETLKRGCAEFLDATIASELNCWEAIFWIGFRALPSAEREAVRTAIVNVITDEIGYHDFVLRKVLAYDMRRPVRTIDDFGLGTVIYFCGKAHVALSLGGGVVVSLWDGPDGNRHLQRTTVKALLKKVVSDPGLYINSVLTLFTEVREAERLMDPLYDLLDRHKENASVTGDEIRRVLGDAGTQLFVQNAVASADSLFFPRGWTTLAREAEAAARA